MTYGSLLPKRNETWEMSQRGDSGMMIQMSEAVKHTWTHDVSNDKKSDSDLTRTRPTTSSRSRQFGSATAAKEVAI